MRIADMDNLWRQVPGYENLYLVSREGRVFGMRYLALMKPVIDPSSGYYNVNLHKAGKMRTIKLHQLVALTFHGRPEGRVVRHLDGNPANNNDWNLAYGSQSDNMADMLRHGREWRGNADKTHCKHGHEFDYNNTRWSIRAETGNPRRACRACEKAVYQRNKNVRRSA